jgi:hypothetical protein
MGTHAELLARADNIKSSTSFNLPTRKSFHRLHRWHRFICAICLI